MKRIAIIGNGGGGKSHLARRLGASLGIPVFEVDPLQWRPGWQRTPEDEIRRVHKEWLAQPAWIIDGWGGWENMQERFGLADRIIWVDLPIWLHYWWATKRHVLAVLGRSPHWPPVGCSALQATWQLYRVMWQIHFRLRGQLEEMLTPFQNKIIHIRSREALGAFTGVGGRP